MLKIYSINNKKYKILFNIIFKLLNLNFNK